MPMKGPKKTMGATKTKMTMASGDETAVMATTEHTRAKNYGLLAMTNHTGAKRPVIRNLRTDERACLAINELKGDAVRSS
jgi:soluble P-type ATPase